MWSVMKSIWSSKTRSYSFFLLSLLPTFMLAFFSCSASQFCCSAQGVASSSSSFVPLHSITKFYQIASTQCLNIHVQWNDIRLHFSIKSNLDQLGQICKEEAIGSLDSQKRDTSQNTKMYWLCLPPLLMTFSNGFSEMSDSSFMKGYKYRWKNNISEHERPQSTCAKWWKFLISEDGNNLRVHHTGLQADERE